MAAGDIQSLRELARAGNPAGLARLGKMLLTGQGAPFSPNEGIRMLEEAARSGQPEAVALVARCAAWGVMRPVNLHEALDGLQRSAELGFEPSGRELRLLAGRADDDWAGMRRQVDLAAWVTPPAARDVSDSPRIRVAEGFASAAECEWLVELGQHGLRRARVYGHDAPGERIAESRTNSESDYSFMNADIVLALLRERIATSLGAHASHFEVTKLLRYEPGERFSLHADYQDPRSPAQAAEIARHGQRIATFLVYLNDGYEGGETDFPEAGVRFRGRRGDALWFSNVDSRGEPDPRSVHAGMPPTRGTKWLLSQWVRDRPLA